MTFLAIIGLLTISYWTLRLMWWLCQMPYRRKCKRAAEQHLWQLQEYCTRKEWKMDIDILRAYLAIEDIRREHNGIFRVDLYYGHDGDNICRFSNYEKILFHGQSGRSMVEAINRCLSAWENKDYYEGGTMKHEDALRSENETLRERLAESEARLGRLVRGIEMESL